MKIVHGAYCPKSTLRNIHKRVLNLNTINIEYFKYANLVTENVLLYYETN